MNDFEYKKPKRIDPESLEKKKEMNRILQNV